MDLLGVYNLLNRVLPDKVFYGSNVYDNFDNASMPFIVYQEITKRPRSFRDNKPGWYRSLVQITLVTKSKDINLESLLERALLDNNLVFFLLSESRNQDKSLNRVYEIYMEEI